MCAYFDVFGVVLSGSNRHTFLYTITIAIVISTTSTGASETYFDRNHTTVVTDYSTTTNTRPPETSFARNLATFAIDATTTTSAGGMKI